MQTHLGLISSGKWNRSKLSHGNARPIRTRNVTIPAGSHGNAALTSFKSISFHVCLLIFQSKKWDYISTNTKVLTYPKSYLKLGTNKNEAFEFHSISHPGIKLLKT